MRSSVSHRKAALRRPLQPYKNIPPTKQKSFEMDKFKRSKQTSWYREIS